MALKEYKKASNKRLMSILKGLKALKRRLIRVERR